LIAAGRTFATFAPVPTGGTRTFGFSARGALAIATAWSIIPAARRPWATWTTIAPTLTAFARVATLGRPCIIRISRLLRGLLRPRGQKMQFQIKILV
jgi:hypothetical protein